jgi:hypothetical protein
MTAVLLHHQVDALAIAAPGERGYGYADTQHPWHHDPAIDLPRPTWLGWLEATIRRLGRGEAVVVGIGAQPARTLSLSLACARCLAVDTDAGRAAKLLAAARDAGRAAAVQTFVGAGGDPSVRAAVGEAIAQCDLLLLDVQDEAELLGALLAHAPRVRDGGRVAIVDRTFEFGERLPERRADQALRQLRELVLEPADARVERHGQAVAIHDFGMDRNVRARLCLLVPPAEAVPAQRSTYRGYTLHRLPDGWLAWPQAAGAFQHERLWRNEAPRCWFATDAAELRVRLEIADAAVAELAAARASFARAFRRCRPVLRCVRRCWPRSRWHRGAASCCWRPEPTNCWWASRRWVRPSGSAPSRSSSTAASCVLWPAPTCTCSATRRRLATCTRGCSRKSVGAGSPRSVPPSRVGTCCSTIPKCC